MDLIQIRNIFRNILQKEFKNEQDLKLLMQFLALILSEYEQNSKLPGKFLKFKIFKPIKIKKKYYSSRFIWL